MNDCWIRPQSGDSCSFVLPKRNGSCPLNSGWPPSPRTPAVSSTSQPAVEERAGGQSMAQELRHYFCTDLGLFLFKPPSTTTPSGVAGLKRRYWHRKSEIKDCCPHNRADALWVLVVTLLKSQHYWEFQYQNMVQCHANVWSLQTSSRWTKIEVEQSKQFEDIVFVIRFDGKEIARTVNHDPRSLSKVSIYMDDCPCFLTKLKEHSRGIC